MTQFGITLEQYNTNSMTVEGNYQHIFNIYIILQ